MLKVIRYTTILFINIILISDTSICQQNENITYKHGSYLSYANLAFLSNITMDNNGNIYGVGGIRLGGSFPTSSGSFQPNPAGGHSDGIVFKMNSTLTGFVWSSYVGGNSLSLTGGVDKVTSVAVNTSGEVFIAGLTEYSSFPTTVPSDTLLYGDTALCFVMKISADGSQILYSRLIGKVDRADFELSLTNFPIYTMGSTGTDDICNHLPYLTLNPQGEAYVLAGTISPTFQVTSGAYQTTKNSATDLTLTKLSTTGNIVYSTYIGGNGADIPRGLAYNNNKLYISGRTSSTNFPLASGKSVDAGDCFVMAWNDGSVPTPIGTYIYGSSGIDDCAGIAYNNARNSINVVGMAGSTSLPYTNQLQATANMGGFLMSVKGDLSGVDYCTMLGNAVRPYSVKVRNNGEPYIGFDIMTSGSIPITPNAVTTVNIQGEYGVLGLSSDGAKVRFGTYLGNQFNDYGTCSIALNEKSPCNFFRLVAGLNHSSSAFPTTSGVLQASSLSSPVLTVFQSASNDTLIVTQGSTCGEYKFRVESRNDCPPTQYLWNFGDGTQTVVGKDTITHKYNKNGSFLPNVQVTLPGGESGYMEKTIVVQSQPTIKASPNVLYYCTKQNGLQLSASGGVRYEWSPGAVFSDSTKQNPIAKPTKNMWLYVRGYDANGCFATDSVQVYVTSVTATASSDTIVCKGTSVTLNASGGAEVKWSPATGLNKPTGKSVIATPTETTTYQVIVGDGDCKDTTHVTISVSNKPKVTLNPAPVICTGGNVQLGAALEGNYIDTLASTYLWTPNINLSNPNIKNPVATPTKTTRYKCTVINKYGCTITDSVEVKVQNNLKIQLSADTSVCAGFGVLLKASGGANYTWYPPDYLDNPNS
ncbi:MAG: PKD domain-containing protein, partial [Bacteriodetes bacterium]|nr:PKD domain-containing protein [Bacteroidota bacterium]